MVEETLAPGASVARVARAHGVNANQVFGWRKLYLAGKLGEQKPGDEVAAGACAARAWPRPLRSEPGWADVAKPQPSTIHIELQACANQD